MSKRTVTVSRQIEAPASTVYNIIADYNHHRNILPPQFFAGLDIEKGGIGAGTQILVHVDSMGMKDQMRMEVTEPEPGVILAERNVDTGLVTTFTVKPVSATQSHIAITSVWEPPSGWRGWVDRLTTPLFMRYVYKQELNLLNDYAQKQSGSSL